jgi:hypothetical protein
VGAAALMGERAAWAKAQREHPGDLDGEADATRNLVSDCRRQVAEEYGIPVDTVHAIVLESIEKGWPLPPKE